MNTITIRARGIIMVEQHLLLCHTQCFSPNYYYLPGGHVEHGEHACTTLRRELQEECNIDCTIGQFLGCYECVFSSPRQASQLEHEYNLIFSATCPALTDITKPPISCEQDIDFAWLPLSSLADIDFRPMSMLPVLSSWIAGENQPAFASNIG